MITIVLKIIIGITLAYEIALGIYFMDRSLNKTVDRRYRIFSCLFFLFYTGMILIEEFYISNLMDDAYNLYIGIHFVFLFIYAFVGKKGRFVFKLYYTFIYLSVILLVSCPSIIIFNPLINAEIIDVTMGRCLMRINDCLLLTCVLFFLLKFKIDPDKKYPGSYYVVMLASSITNLVSFNMPKPLFNSNPLIPYLGITSFAIEIIIYFMIWQSTTEYNSRIRLELIAQQEDYQKEHMNELKNIIEEYHKLRHDTKNQFAIMDRMISQEKYGELKNYFYNLTKDIYELDNQIETGNEIVNQVINIKYASAHQLGIPIDIHMILPNDLGLPDHEICSLLSNLIDNAIEASSKIEQPQIWIKMYIKKSYLCLKISNRIETWQSDKALSHITSKQDQNAHGLGWNIINDIIEKHNGIYSYYIEEDVYNAEVMIII